MEGTIYSLIPAFITVLLVIITKNIVLSLGIGIISSALFITGFSILESVTTVLSTFYGLIIDSGGLFGIFNNWNVSIIIFLLFLGIITSYVILSGGSKSFSQVIISRVRTREGVQFVTFILGITMFIDDYFNALVVGNVSKPLVNEKKISRARLSYIVDSTSAPLCVIAPISSWATGIMGTMGVVFATVGLDYNVFVAFMRTIPYHFYVITCVILVYISIRYQLNFNVMNKYEEEALSGQDSSISKDESVNNEDIKSAKGTIWDLLLPICTLTFVTIGVMLVTGVNGAMINQSDYNLFYDILNNLNLPMSLVYGGLLGAIVAMITAFRHVKSGEISKKMYFSTILKGFSSMRGSILILLFAWAISDLIGELGVGDYLASIILNSSLGANFIPAVMFIVAGFLAFSTGTSWGSFGILIPIAGTVVASIDMDLMIPVIAAVLSGAVFGDHSSPISDTTLLSSTGSGCKVDAHFRSQLPYTMLAAGIATIGYLIYGLTNALLVSYIVIFLCFIVVILYARFKRNSSLTFEN